VSPLGDPLFGAMAGLRTALLEVGEATHADRRDAVILRGVARVTDDIDLAHVRRVIQEFAAALDEPERVEDFERLLARVRGKPRRSPRG